MPLYYQDLTMIAKHMIRPSIIELRNETIASSLPPMYVSNTRTDMADPWGEGRGGGEWRGQWGTTLDITY